MSNRKRLFTNEFKKGDKVAIIREEHGWHDGALEGVITDLGPEYCVVRVKGCEYYINHPRDIYKV